MADLIHDLSVLGLEIAQKEALPVPLRTTFIGNTVSVIPEPETYLMLVAGLGLLGFMVRQRNRAF